jgi:hypothetical protein
MIAQVADACRCVAASGGPHAGIYTDEEKCTQSVQGAATKGKFAGVTVVFVDFVIFVVGLVVVNVIVFWKRNAHKVCRELQQRVRSMLLLSSTLLLFSVGGVVECISRSCETKSFKLSGWH